MIYNNNNDNDDDNDDDDDDNNDNNNNHSFLWLKSIKTQTRSKNIFFISWK